MNNEGNLRRDILSDITKADIEMVMVYYKEFDSGISFGKDSVTHGKKNLCFGTGIQRSRLIA